MRALLQARARGHAIGRDAIAKINLSLRESLTRLDLDSDNPLTQLRAQRLRGQILAMIQRLEEVTIGATRNSVRLTVKEIVGIHQRANARLLEQYLGSSADLTARFDNISVRVLNAIGSRARNAATFQTIVRRHMQEAVPEVDRLLMSSISQGVSSRKLAKDLEAVMKGDFPSLQDYGMRKGELAGLRTISYDARMIAISETNNAMRESNVIALQQSPVVIGATWQLSGAHGAEDECDDLARANDYGLGPGVYPMNEFPVAPHPHCGCYQGDVVFRPPEQWLEPKVYPAPYRLGALLA